MSETVSMKNRDRFIQLGITIAAYRKLRGMSQYDLADRSNVSRSCKCQAKMYKKGK